MSEKNQKSQRYWRRRAIQFEKDWFNRSQKTIEKKLADHYQKALSAIHDDILKLYGNFAKDNGLDFDEAKKLLNSQEYRRWRMSMQEYLQQIAGGDVGLERELNTLAMRPRINRLEKLYAETLQELDKLGRNVDADIKNFLADGYTGTYAKDIFDLVKIGGLSVAIAKVENIHVEKVLASRWSGKTFSQRIWTNTKLLNGVLRETISSGVHRGLSIQQLAGNPELLKLSIVNEKKSVAENMRNAYRNAVRLVRTEMNFVNNQAHADSMKDAGVEQYEFMAVMDGRTSQKCRERDGEHFLLEKKVVGENYPPLHPRCRSTVCPFIEGVSRKGTRIAKVGGKNIDIPENMSYTDYQKVYIDKAQTLEDWKKSNPLTGSKVSAESDILKEYDSIVKQYRLAKNEYQKAEIELEKAEPRWHSLSDKEREKLNNRRDEAKVAMQDANDKLKPIRIAAAKNGGVLTSELSQVYDVSDIKAIADKVKNAPENIRVLWNLTEGEMKILDKNYRGGIPHYDRKEHGIKLDLNEDRFSKNQRPYKTTFHEIGHLVDHWIGRQMYFNSAYYKGGIFGNTLRQEAEDYVNSTLMRLKQEAVASGKSAKSLKKTDAYSEISQELRKIDKVDRREISDIWHGATNKKVNAGFVHDDKGYWTDNRGENVCTETFAHMFCATIQNPESLASIQKYFPKSYKIFEEMVNEAVSVLI